MIYMQEKNETTSVKISKYGSKCLDEIVRESGVGKIELVTRMAEWLVHQDKSVRAIVLRQVESFDEIALIESISTRLKHPHIDRVTNKLLFDVKKDKKLSLDNYQLARQLIENKKSDIEKLEKIVAIDNLFENVLEDEEKGKKRSQKKHDQSKSA